jgi:hypothetical protein
LTRTPKNHELKHAVPTNGPARAAFRFDVKRPWWQSLRRRGQNDRTTRAKFGRLAATGTHPPSLAKRSLLR